MPTYDYRCSACNVEYELREGFDAPSAHTCQQCGKGEARRLLRPPAVVFKGSGFYATDSRGSSASSAASSDSGAGSDAAAPSTAPAPAADAGHSHGHSHGPGGHTH